jgi:hypothetical protein
MVMLAKFREKKLPFRIEMLNVRWYPSSRSCVRPSGQKLQPQQMPPLMVRKAEWRR